jgi:peroxiredoxin Q/BCP
MTVSVGEKAPDFSLPGSDGSTVKLSALRDKGPAVLVFYCADNTPG